MDIHIDNQLLPIRDEEVYRKKAEHKLLVAIEEHPHQPNQDLPSPVFRLKVIHLQLTRPHIAQPLLHSLLLDAPISPELGLSDDSETNQVDH